MIIKKMALLSACVIVLFVPGCAQYQARPLRKLPVVQKSPEQTISFEYQLFDKNDCKYYLDRDVLKKGYQPIHLTIHNNSSQSVNFSLSNFTIPCVPYDEVAEMVHTSTVGRVVGYSIAGIFIWPFFIGALVDGIGSEKANERLDVDFARKALRSQSIPPHSSINGLIFTPLQDFDENFSFNLTDATTNNLVTLSTARPVTTLTPSLYTIAT